MKLKQILKTPIMVLALILGAFLFYFSAPFFYRFFAELSEYEALSHPRPDDPFVAQRDVIMAGLSAFLLSFAPAGFVWWILEKRTKK